MAISDFDPEFRRQLDSGLNLLGWRIDIRMTSEDALLLMKPATEALRARDEGTLDPTALASLSIDAYQLVYPSLMDPRNRAWRIAAQYRKSRHMAGVVPLVDEATLAFYRAYDTIALAGLFVALERYLRSLIGWKPGAANVGFKQLRQAVNQFEDSSAKHQARRMLDGVYSHYDALEPPPFHYNRHGLLHGLRGPLRLDEINAARTLSLLDTLVAAELPAGSGCAVVVGTDSEREAIYGGCVPDSAEMTLLGRADSGDTEANA